MKYLNEYIKPSNGVTVLHYVIDASICISMVLTYNILTH
jgi:hypothetical protein